MGLPFVEAIAFLRDRLKVSPDDWLAIVREADAAAADRAAGMKDALVRDITEAIARAIEDGTTAATFADAFDQLTRSHGWRGDNEAGWRSTLTFRTMTSQAVAAGRWQQIQRTKASRPWLRYITAGDHRVRDAHAAWNGLVLHCDDPWWDTHFPPNGFNCRCHVQSLSDIGLKRYGHAVGEAPPDNPVTKIARMPDGTKRAVEVPAGIDPGFAVHWGKAGLKLLPRP